MIYKKHTSTEDEVKKSLDIVIVGDRIAPCSINNPSMMVCQKLEEMDYNPHPDFKPQGNNGFVFCNVTGNQAFYHSCKFGDKIIIDNAVHYAKGEEDLFLAHAKLVKAQV